MKEVYWMIDVFYKLVSKETFPKIRFVRFSATFAGKICAFESILLNLLHTVFYHSLVVLIIERVQKNCGISNDSELSLSLSHKIIAPLQGSESSIESTDHHNFFSIFKEVDFVEIVDSFFDVLRTSEVDFLSFEGNWISVSQETTTVTTFDDHFRPICEVSSALKTQNSRKEKLTSRPISR